MNTVTPNNTPWRHRDFASPHYLNRQSLLKPKRQFWRRHWISLALIGVLASIAGWNVGAWLAR